MYAASAESSAISPSLMRRLRSAHGTLACSMSCSPARASGGGGSCRWRCRRGSRAGGEVEYVNDDEDG